MLEYHHERATGCDRDSDGSISFGDDLAAGHASVVKADADIVDIEDGTDLTP